MKPIDADKNALDATRALLDFSNVPVTRLGLKEALWQHPDFPSLSSLSDVLNDFQVLNLSTRLTPDRLQEIPLPALTYLTIDGGIFAPLCNVNGSIEWLHTRRGWQKESLEQFSQKWSGVTLLIEPNAQSGERDYAHNRHREMLGGLRMLFVVGTILIMLGLLALNALRTFPLGFYSTYYLIALTKLAGTIVSGMLVWYSIDTQNEFLQKVCQINVRSNCQNILNSSAAKLTNWLSWAEIGLFYFAGGLLTTAIGFWMGNEELLVSMSRSLYLLALLALPYTAWSVYHQWFVAREWCVLCLSIQALLWVEFMVAFNNFGWPMDAVSWLAQESIWKIAATTFLITPLLWTIIKPTLRKSIAYRPLLKEFQKLKFDPLYLKGLLNEPKILPPIFEEMRTVTIGQLYAENVLTIVTSPLCGPCAKLHWEISQLLKDQLDLKFQFIFVGSREASQVAAQFLNANENELINLMDSWYHDNRQDVDKWVRQNGSDSVQSHIVQQLTLYNRWCELADIIVTPTIFINDIKLPAAFRFKDIKRIILLLNQIKNEKLHPS